MSEKLPTRSAARPPPGLIAQVRSTVSSRRLVQAGDSVLCAVSGGPDSAAMLAILSVLAQPLGLTLHAASVNHGLRAEGAADLEIARSQALRSAVPFVGLSIHVSRGPGIQARARAARYKVLGELARELGARRIAVGHTLDDQAETVLMRQLRGSGLRGLSGIEPLRDDGVIRPLIDCRRSEVHRYARATFSCIANDSSNEDTSFERVRIRKELMPALAREDVAVARHLAQLADEAREAIAFLESIALQHLPSVCSEDGSRLRLGAVAELPAALRGQVMRSFVRTQTGADPSRAHQDQLLACLRGYGEVWLPGARSARVRDGQWLEITSRGGR